MPSNLDKSHPPDQSTGIFGDFSARIRKAEEELKIIEKELADPAAARNSQRFREVSRRYSRLGKIVSFGDRSREIAARLREDQKLLEEEEEDGEFLELIHADLEQLTAERDEIRTRLEELLLPPDEQEGRNVIMEIRAGTGGEEAALFAAELGRMYARFAEKKGLKVQNLNTHPAARGGVKEMVFAILGEQSYRLLKFESGVHRVQRVPETESQGRIHTSAATVAVLPEVEEVEVEINPADLRVDTFCSSGPGGQSVNTTYSAIRITHLPTGLVVTCQDEKSQHKNKASAMRVLRARLAEQHRREQEQELSRQRKEQVKSGDRSDKIRTYNYPQNRLTDHRINLSLYCLEDIMNGDLDLLIKKLTEWERENKLRRLESA